MSCEILPRDYPKISEVEELRSTYIANCVFNSFLSYAAIVLNIRDLKIPRFRVRIRVGLPVPVLGYTGNQSNLRYTG